MLNYSVWFENRCTGRRKIQEWPTRGVMKITKRRKLKA